MRRTNAKATKEAVRNYLLSCEDGTLKEIRSRFINEYGHMVARIGETNACIEWLRGLGISVAFCYCDIIKLLAEWLDDTEENQEKWIDKKGDNLYWLLLAREIVASK